MISRPEGGLKEDQGGFMSLRKGICQVLGGAALLVIAVAPSAMAKNKDSGTFSGACLASDSALQGALGITDPTIAPVQVTTSAASLWPPNHKMRSESLSVNLTQPFALTPPASPYQDGADISVWVVDLTDDQVATDGAGGGCGKPTAKQGLDWAPAVDIADPTSYVSGAAVLTDATPAALSFTDQSSNPVDIALRGERCASDGTRTYTISLVCCDTTDPSSIVCDDAALATTPPTEPTTTEALNIEVLKSRGHHGKP
jgi:hypothetical protein